MGCGKSRILLDTVAWLWLKDKIDALILVAPKGCYNDWPDSHIPTHLIDEVKREVLTWRASPSKTLLDSFRGVWKPDPKVLHIFVFNIESIAVRPGGKPGMALKIITAMLQSHRSMLSIDESTTIGNPSADRTKAMLKLGKLAAYRRILTGDPCPNSPLTAYSQAEFLSSGLLGHSSYSSFKGEFCELTSRPLGAEYGVDGTTRRRLVKVIDKAKADGGFKNLDLLQERLASFSFIVKKSDCLDLPQKIYHERSVEMGPKQRKAYNEMQELAWCTLESAEDIAAVPAISSIEAYLAELAGELIAPDSPSLASQSTANLVITQLLRLHQICCGFMVTDDGTEVAFDEPNTRLNSLLELAEENPQGGIIWANYRFNIFQIRDAFEKKFGTGCILTYFGDTTIDERRSAKLDFQSGRTSWFLGSQATGKYGLTLTRAELVAYYSNNFDQELRNQSEDRAHRIGQTKNVNYFDLIVRGTVEEKIINALRGKKRRSELISPSNWRDLFGKAA